MHTLLRQLRISKGLTQARLAAMAGISQATECNHENGRHGMARETAKRYAKALGLRDWRVLLED